LPPQDKQSKLSGAGFDKEFMEHDVLKHEKQNCRRLPFLNQTRSARAPEVMKKKE
jgi:hypothetical protein